MSTIQPAQPSFIGRLGLAVQWTVFAGASLLAALTLSNLNKRNIPDAPLIFLYVMIGLTVAAALANLPPIFLRLPFRGKLSAYVAILPLVFLYTSLVDHMAYAYDRTPEGARKLAQQEAAAAKQEAADQAAKNEAARQAAADKQASLDAQKPAVCDALVKQVADGKDVLEVNNVSVETSTQPNEVLTCSGDAITSHGNGRIEFGLVTTPQGKQLVSIRFP